MIYHENIERYLQWVKDNPDKVNNDRKIWIDNIFIPILESDNVYFDVETYEKCIKYCEKNYYKLFPYQLFIYAFVFMYWTETDFPVFNTFFIVMGRGNGKDGMMMPLLNFLQTPMYGVKNYHIDIIANNEDQAKDSFSVVYEMMEEYKAKFRKMFYWSKEIVKNLKTRAELRFNTSNAKTKDGKKSGAIFFNEYHAYETYDQINVFSSQLGKIKHARTFIVSTNGYVRGGPMDDMIALCREIGKKGEYAEGYFAFMCWIDDESEIDMPERWIKANPSLEYMPVLKNQIMKDWKDMQRLPSKRPEFVAKRMNLAAALVESVIAKWEDILATTYKDVENRVPIDEPSLEGRNAVIAIDYADIRDFASAGVLFKIDSEYVWRQKTWICKNSPHFNDIKFPFANYGQDEFRDFEVLDSNSLSPDLIVQWCIEQTKLYFVQKIIMDTYRFSLFREAFEQCGLSIESKANPYGLVRMVRYQKSVYVIVAPKIEVALAEHHVNFGRSAIMRWYTNNTALNTGKDGNKTFEKIEPKLRKNDGFMAFVIAMFCEEMLNEKIVYV